MPPTYTTDQGFLQRVESIYNDPWPANSPFQSAFWGFTVWRYIVTAEFEDQNWYRPSRRWDNPLRMYILVASKRGPTSYQLGHHINSASLVITTMTPEDDESMLRHRKFEDDARRTVLEIIEWSEYKRARLPIVYAVVHELVVIFFQWTGWEYGPGKLTKLVVEDAGSGKKYSGALHVVDDADGVNLVLEHIKATEVVVEAVDTEEASEE
ncbi:hypothetical protein TWF696_009606 [Orbilia brochopaga]|uniref:Uncharacterized protein n=1 Tax=Orbilia brochopaga TaxID=3140254 RepID=A0AAV9UES7_9PEZI